MIANKESFLDYICEKFSCPTDKSKHGHGYNKVYDRYFESYRGKELNFLEIGCASGESAQMWHHYFSASKIVTIDIDVKNYKYPPNDRIVVLEGSQTDTDFLLEVNNEYGPFDIIIDDGSHLDAYTKISFDTLFPHLKAGGMYVVEDLHTSYRKVVHGVENSDVFMQHLKSLIDYTNSHGHCMTGDVLRCSQNLDYEWCEHRKMEEMDKLIEFIHFYKSLAFIKKY